MKKLIVVCCMLLFVGCVATSEPFKNRQEYASGKKLAEVYAKKDAINLNCFNYFNFKMGIISSNLQKHIAALKTEKSEDFLSGFSAVYQQHYLEYAKIYCN